MHCNTTSKGASEHNKLSDQVFSAGNMKYYYTKCRTMDLSLQASCIGKGAIGSKACLPARVNHTQATRQWVKLSVLSIKLSPLIQTLVFRRRSHKHILKELWVYAEAQGSADRMEWLLIDKWHLDWKNHFLSNVTSERYPATVMLRKTKGKLH